ncbi:MAG: hypothetical protein Q7S68_02815 [Deltaproteobacteria bacterium]|nr:hypothetical protein [Deltaproteobacteria bacterium]
MITLSNGHSFQFMAASGALAFDGRGWPWEWPLRWIGLIKPECFTIVGKSLTLKPRQGNLRWSNPFSCVRLLKNGTVNAIGLTNPGIDWWIKEVYLRLTKTNINFIVSIAGESLEEYVEMTIRLREAGPASFGAHAPLRVASVPKLSPAFLKGIEINASCPNSPSELHNNTQAVIETVRAVTAKTNLPLLLKLSCTHDYVAIAKALEGVVEAISINSVPWGTIYPNTKSPLANLGGGGVSGKLAQEKNWKMVSALAAQTKIPVIGPSVWEYEDIQKLFNLGARAVSFGAIFLRYPWRPTRFVERYLQESKN